MELHLVDHSGQTLDVSLALDALTMGVLAGALCALIGQLTTSPTALATAPALAAAGVWALHHRAHQPPPNAPETPHQQPPTPPTHGAGRTAAPIGDRVS